MSKLVSIYLFIIQRKLWFKNEEEDQIHVDNADDENAIKDESKERRRSLRGQSRRQEQKSRKPLKCTY